MSTDNKFITFARTEFMDWIDSIPIDIRGPLNCEIKDAVVIRTQDTFAGPALHSYAATITNVIDAFKSVGYMAMVDKLQPVADYFHQRAVEADEIAAGMRTPRYPT